MLTLLLRPFTPNVLFSILGFWTDCLIFTVYHQKALFKKVSFNDTWLKCLASVCTSCFKKYEYIYNFWHYCGALFYKLSLQLVAFFRNELLINYSRYCLSSLSHQALLPALLSQPVLELLLGLSRRMPHSHQLSPLYSCHHLPQESSVLFPAHFNTLYCITNMFQHDTAGAY